MSAGQIKCEDAGRVKCEHGYPVCNPCLVKWVRDSRRNDLYEFLYEVWTSVAEETDSENAWLRAADYKQLMFRWSDARPFLES